MIQIVAKHASTTADFSVDVMCTSYAQLTRQIALHFNLDPTTLKLIGLIKGSKAPSGDALLSTLSLPSSVKVMVVGTPSSVLKAIDARTDEHAARELAAEIQRQELEQCEFVRQQELERVRSIEREQQRKADEARQQEMQARRLEMAREQERIRIENEKKARECIHSLPVYAASSVGNSDADFQSKIDLPAFILEEVMSKNLTTPMFFRLSAPNSHAVYHVSVLDFTANQYAVVSSQVLQMFQLQDGESITIEYCQPPAATFVRLKTESVELMLLAEPVRKALLEQTLRHHMLLSEGDHITLSYGRRSYSVVVDSLQPEPSCRSIDVDLPVDLIGPSPSNESAAAALPLSDFGDMLPSESFGGSTAASIPAQPSLVRSSSTLVIPQLNLSDCLACTFNSEPAYFYFRVPSDVPHDSQLQLKLTASSSLATGQNVVLRVRELNQSSESQASSIAVIASQLPAVLHFDWMAVATSAPALIALPVQALTASTFVLSLSNSSPDCSVDVELTLQVQEPAQETSSSNSVKCSLCRKQVPSASIHMHELSCARTNVVCTTCDQVILLRDKAVHDTALHAPLICDCGESVLTHHVPHHYKRQCALREVECRYCPLQFAAVDLNRHQAECLNHQVLCHHCHASMKAYEARHHCLSKHDVATEAVRVGIDFS